MTAEGPVPAEVQLGQDRLTIDRAWPKGRRDGHELVLIEGRDRSHGLRAGRLWLRPSTGLGWQVAKVEMTPAGVDPRLPELTDHAADGTLLVHRFGRRAVVRRSDDYVKVVRPGQAAAVARAAQQGRVVAQAAGFGAPTVGATTNGSVSFGILPGRSLHELGGVLTTAEWGTWWRRFAERWPALAQPANRAQGATPTPHTAHDEVSVLRGWLESTGRLEALPADLHGHLAARVETVTTALLGEPAQEPVISHRDLHDKQILAQGSSLGLLDFDTVALAEPALDLANLWVHAHLRAEQGLWSARHRDVAQQEIRASADALGVTPTRFATYAEATRLRLICLYAFRPRHRRLALAWAAADPAPV